jgi:hypothetical protein
LGLARVAGREPGGAVAAIDLLAVTSVRELREALAITIQRQWPPRRKPRESVDSFCAGEGYF